MIDDVLPGVSNGPATLSQALVEMENGMTTKIEHGDAIELELLGVKQKTTVRVSRRSDRGTPFKNGFRLYP